MDKTKFNRIEKKYLVKKSQMDEILGLVQKYTEPDEYFQSSIYNIYFDTDGCDFIIKSIDQPTFKQKLRARSYEGFDKVFFELKTKLALGEDHQGFKRRVKVSHQDYDNIINGKTTLLQSLTHENASKSDLQIGAEITYFIDYFDLKPKFLVYYDRTSFRGEDDLRITFDEHIKYREKDLNYTKKPSDRELLKDAAVMEIKASGRLPMWLVQMLDSKQIYPERFSKIGKVYENTRKEQNV